MPSSSSCQLGCILAGRQIGVWLVFPAIGLLGLWALSAVHPWQGIALASSSAGDPTAARLVSPEEPCQSPIFGDIDGDEAVGAPDALWILKKIVKLPLPEGGDGCASMDVDCDSDVDAVDALKILRSIVGLPVAQMEPCPNIGSSLG